VVADLHAGRDVMPQKQIRYRQSVDPGVQPEGGEFSAPEHPHRADTAGLTDAEAATDRPGPSAPVEIPPDDPSRDGT
jgi:hypothetical protein